MNKPFSPAELRNTVKTMLSVKAGAMAPVTI